MLPLSICYEFDVCSGALTLSFRLQVLMCSVTGEGKGGILFSSGARSLRRSVQGFQKAPGKLHECPSSDRPQRKWPKLAKLAYHFFNAGASC
jgi:hypothetical protein